MNARNIAGPARGSVPARLYKYRPLDEHTISLLVNDELFLSKPSAFNDPFDCRIRLSYKATKDGWKATVEKLFDRGLLMHVPEAEKKASLERLAEAGAFNTESYQRLLQGMLHEELDRTFGICCFSARSDDLLMWSHYADGHKGCCLEFDAQRLKRAGLLAYEVHYRRNYPRRNSHKLMRASYDLFATAMLTKADTWKSECEWRVITDQGAGLYGFPPTALTRIILGARTRADKERLILNLARQRSPPIGVLRASESESEFRLNLTSKIGEGGRR